MAWMNEHEIDETVEVMARRAPALHPYAKYLSDWRDTVNANSDGWPYWRAGGKAAEKLMAALGKAKDALRSGSAVPGDEAFKGVLAPIKAAATRHGLTAPTLAATAPASHAHWDKFDPANEKACWDEITAMAVRGEPPTSEHPTVLRLNALAHACGHAEADSFLSDHGTEAGPDEDDEAAAERIAFERYEDGEYFACIAKSEEIASKAARAGKGGELAARPVASVAAGMRESYEEGRAERYEASASPTP